MTSGAPVETRDGVLVTALFADVSGFTTLADALDTDDLHEIIHPMIKRLTGVAERAGGLLVKFGGDAILCVFSSDGDDADHATRAIDAAVAMHHELEAMKVDLPPAGAGLSMHIGVGTGALPLGLDLEGGLSDKAVLGESVELAQRVESQTPTGSTYVSGSTAALVGDVFTFAFIGEKQLRGFVDPVPLWEVVGRADGALVSEALTEHALTELHRAMDDESASLPVEQRRVVSVLFADPVVTADDDRDTRALVVEVAERLGSICQRYGAHVARYAGDAVLAFFGAPVAHEDDADRALLAAMGMHSSCRKLSAEHGVDIQVRVGVNTGRVIADHFGGEVRADFSILGDAVNTAQRIEASAPLGETYVSKTTQQLTAGKFGFEFAGRLQLKGKPKPVPAWRLTGAGSAHRSHAADRERTAFVARDAEMTLLEEALDRLDEGASATLAVLGEPGVGKSRLTRELQTRVRDTGYDWHTGQCISYGASVPYWPIADLFRTHLDLTPESTADAVIEAVAGSLNRLGLEGDIPFITRLLGHSLSPDPLVDLEPEALRRGIQDAVGRWVVNKARRTPLVFAIEDLQWIDDASADLLDALVRTSDGQPVGLYLTSRPEGDDAVRRVLDASRTAVDVTLQPFGPEDTDLLVEAILGGPADDDMSATIAARTQGNPLFTTEVVRTLVENDQLMQDDRGEWIAKPGWSPDQVPASVEGVISARIDRLPQQTANVLTVGSVIGRRILLPILERLLPDVELDLEMRALMDAGFVDPASDRDADEVVIHHALVQDVAYSRLVRRRRQNLHLRVAEVGEEIYGDGDDVIDLLARHLYLANAGTKAVDYLERAGRRAKRLYANEQAIEHFTHAAELAEALDDEQHRLVDALVELGEIEVLVGHLERAAGTFERATEVDQDPRAFLGLSSARLRLGQHAVALDAADRAASLDPENPELAARTALQKALAYTATSDLDLVLQVVDGATGSDEIPDELRAELLIQRGMAASLQERPEAAVQDGTMAAEVARRAGNPRILVRALRLAGQASIRISDLDGAERLLGQAVSEAGRIGYTEELAQASSQLGIVHHFRSSPGAAIDAMRRAVEAFERIGHATGTPLALNNLAMLEMETGQIDSATEHAERALMLAQDAGNARFEADVLDTLARLSLAAGRPIEAVTRAVRAGDLCAQVGAEAAATEYYELALAAAERLGEGESGTLSAELARASSWRSGRPAATGVVE